MKILSRYPCRKSDTSKISVYLSKISGEVTSSSLITPRLSRRIFPSSNIEVRFFFLKESSLNPRYIDWRRVPFLFPIILNNILEVSFIDDMTEIMIHDLPVSPLDSLVVSLSLRISCHYMTSLYVSLKRRYTYILSASYNLSCKSDCIGEY